MGHQARGGDGWLRLEFRPRYLDPWVFGGILLLSGWVLSRMALLSWADLSYVIPVTSVGFVLNAVMGAVFLGEVITPTRWLGTLCIVGGTVLVGLTAPKTETH